MARILKTSSRPSLPVARYGVLPIENSSTGGITDVYDLIHRYDCCVVGEKYVKVEHCLLTLPGRSSKTFAKSIPIRRAEPMPELPQTP